MAIFPKWKFFLGHPLVIKFLSPGLGAVSDNPWSYAVSRVIAGAGSIGCFLMSFTLLCEMVGKKSTIKFLPWHVTIFSFLGNIIAVPYALGEASNSIIGKICLAYHTDFCSIFLILKWTRTLTDLKNYCRSLNLRWLEQVSSGCLLSLWCWYHCVFCDTWVSKMVDWDWQEKESGGAADQGWQGQWIRDQHPPGSSHWEIGWVLLWWDERCQECPQLCHWNDRRGCHGVWTSL